MNPPAATPAGVKRLKKLGMIPNSLGMGALDMNTGGWVGGRVGS